MGADRRRPVRRLRRRAERPGQDRVRVQPPRRHAQQWTQQRERRSRRPYPGVPRADRRPPRAIRGQHPLARRGRRRSRRWPHTCWGGAGLRHSRAACGHLGRAHRGRGLRARTDGEDDRRPPQWHRPSGGGHGVDTAARTGHRGTRTDPEARARPRSLTWTDVRRLGVTALFRSARWCGRRMGSRPFTISTHPGTLMTLTARAGSAVAALALTLTGLAYVSPAPALREHRRHGRRSPPDQEWGRDRPV